MNRAIWRAVSALALIGATVLSTAPAASAVPNQSAAARPAAIAAAKLTPASNIGVLALSCPSGMLCIWPNTDGSSGRCTWVNADNDWRSTPVVCSWTSSQPVKAVYNNGTSASYDGVCLFQGANYVTAKVWVEQGAWGSDPTGWSLRSHKWTRPTDPC
ncbi:hypothetical protein Cs7R123_56290 [Catellatospora sp. TT07R-123]|uniref:peptidase inhibitor family I36 protein n=1 Tax=Catellatospora sp. TT07R-123 TaxID=2733863 RepID=UPI001B094A02|nr:peptidase inhibitor family I36 protein [Catellatospora sp. TT07R-123]GHJ48287.1 hypothetical protein Cs7R123_56290 [Catellatospora sp. TT07R-123]